MKTTIKSLWIILTLTVTSSVMFANVYTYDAAGRLHSVRYDSGLETTYTYDKNGNITKVTTAMANSVSDDHSVQTVEAFPMPATDWLTLRGIPEGEVHLTVTSVHGACVMNMLCEHSGTTLSVDVQALAPGTYGVKAVVAGKTYNTHIVVM